MNKVKPDIFVSAAIFVREAEGSMEYLLARRPEGKVYAGYWEFPGGKLEAGESKEAALVREIDEELQVTITAFSLWQELFHEYPHGKVHLAFFLVTDWEGEIAPVEHSATAWVSCQKEPEVSPVLPANHGLLQALSSLNMRPLKRL